MPKVSVEEANKDGVLCPRGHPGPWRPMRGGTSRHCKQCDADDHLKSKYKLTAEAYSILFTQQGGKCAACGSLTKLVVDHDHMTGEVRGLLCYGCNTLAGFVESRLDNVRRYLEQYWHRKEDDGAQG